VENSERNGCLKWKNPMKLYDVGDFTFFEPCIVTYQCNKNQQNAHFLH